MNMYPHYVSHKYGFLEVWIGGEEIRDCYYSVEHLNDCELNCGSGILITSYAPKVHFNRILNKTVYIDDVYTLIGS